MNERKKIIFACEIYPPDIGGPATYARELREQLLLHGYTVTSFTFGDKEEIKNEETIVIDRKKNVFGRSLNYFYTLLRLSKTGGVIYAMGPVASGLPAVAVGWLRKCRVIIRVPGDRAWETHCQRVRQPESFEEFQHKTHKGWVGILTRIERLVVKRADHIVVPSNFLKNVVISWGADENHVTVISNAIKAPISELPHQENLLSILAIGRLVPWKGFSDLIHAFQTVLKSYPHATLTIVGDGPERRYLENLARQSNVAVQTHFTGSVPRENLARYWQQASVFALPSGYEGFPHLVLEAWAAGIPVLVSDIPGNTGIVRNGENGLVVPYKDNAALSNGILALALDADLRQRMRANGAQSLAQYRWERIIGKTIALLKIS
jgi:glycosyltransferase involved in cell wall biosynthesis